VRKQKLFLVIVGGIMAFIGMGFAGGIVRGESEARPLNLPGKIVFQTDREVRERDGIFLLKDGQMSRIVDGVFPRLTRDGQKLFYTSGGAVRIFDFSNQETQPLEWLSRLSPYDFQLSPDGQWMLFTSHKVLHSKYPNPELNLMVARIDGSEMRQLTDAGVGIGKPSWSPDGSLILFHWPHDRERNEGGGLFVIRPDGTGLRQVVSGLTSYGAEANWSPDGNTIVFNKNFPDEKDETPMELFLVNVDGSGLRQITHDRWWKRNATFSPDGKQILYSSARHGDALVGSVLYVVNVDGTDERRVTPLQKIRKYGRQRLATDQNLDWAP